MGDKLNIYSIFPSISGEVGLYKQGEWVTFIRLSGCNLRCEYCDTQYAFDTGISISIDEILDRVVDIGIKGVLITGGEPLIQIRGVTKLIQQLKKLNITISIETNGSIPIPDIQADCWVVDYKLSSSGNMDRTRIKDILLKCPHNSWIKFVISDYDDYKTAKKVAIKDLYYPNYLGLAFSPCLGRMNPDQLYQWMLRDRLYAYNIVFSPQIHKLCKLNEVK